MEESWCHAAELNGLSSDFVVKVVSQTIGQPDTIGPKLGDTIHAAADKVNQKLQEAFDDETGSQFVADEVRRLLSTDNMLDWQGDLNP